MGRAENNLERSEEDHGSGARVPLDAVPGTSPDSGVRTICPFCGASNPTAEYFCCADWFAMMFPASETEESGVRRPSWLVLPRLETIRETIQGRLRQGSQLLVTLLASAIVAVLASVATRSRIASEHPTEIPLAPLQRAQPIAEPANADAAPEVASVAPRRSLPPMGPEVATSESSSAASPAAPQQPTAVRVDPEAAPATTESAPSPVQAAPQAPAVEIASVKTDAVVTAPPVAASESSGRPPTVKPARAPARPRKLSVPEPAAKVPARAEVPEPDGSQPQIATSLSPPESEVVRRAAQEAATVWREPGRIPRLAESVDSSHWHSLRRGMNRDAVRRLLGEPKWKRHLVGTEVWLYEENSLFSDGWVSFADPGEELTGWRGASSTH
jgi:hypothetical protein